jgi:hypothetical protein
MTRCKSAGKKGENALSGALFGSLPPAFLGLLRFVRVLLGELSGFNSIQ